MKELTILANKYKSDKGTEQGSSHGFTEIYDYYFIKLKDSCINLLEIGIQDGSSLKMWYEYFPKATIYGLDINNKKDLENDRISCAVIDQSNRQQLEEFSTDKDIKFDIIIDDGSHHMLDQQLTFGFLFPLLKSDGIYIIEDLHTSLCDNNTMVYERPIEIYSDKSNTTLHYLTNKPFRSVYLTEQQNEYIQKNIMDVLISDRENPLVPADYKHRSITSIITKL